jgi:hypothetical protein
MIKFHKIATKNGIDYKIKLASNGEPLCEISSDDAETVTGDFNEIIVVNETERRTLKQVGNKDFYADAAFVALIERNGKDSLKLTYNRHDGRDWHVVVFRGASIKTAD